MDEELEDLFNEDAESPVGGFEPARFCMELELPLADDLNDILEQIGPEYRKWLVDLWKQYEIDQEPILAPNGTVLAEPLFTLHQNESRWACFGTTPTSPESAQALKDAGI